jgi:hypothetical protein
MSGAAMGNAAVEWGSSADCAVGGVAPGKSYKRGGRAGAAPPTNMFADCSRARARRASPVMGESGGEGQGEPGGDMSNISNGEGARGGTAVGGLFSAPERG